MTEKSSPAAGTSRRNFLKVGAGAVALGAVVATVVEVPTLTAASHEAQITSLTTQVAALQQQATQITTLQNQSSGLQTELDTFTGFLYLTIDEQILLASVVNAIIPSDSNGPGANSAGVIYFIDRLLAGDYGWSGNMYMRGPFVMPNQTTPVTVNGQVYAHGTPKQRVSAGTGYQYRMDMRYFWRYSTQAFASYCVSAYGNAFQDLTNTQQASALADLWNNKPTSFNGIIPSDFAYELFYVVWAGFLMDPLYGGNTNMSGWSYVGFNGTNMGNFYGEGKTPISLATASSPTLLQPASLAQFQQSQLQVVSPTPSSSTSSSSSSSSSSVSSSS